MAGPPLAAAIAAGQRLLDAAGSTDKVGLVVFDDSARTVTPLTGNVQAVQTALPTLTTNHGTALYDGIGDAARLTGRADGSRRVVVVLSDGDDTTSAISLDDLTAALAGDGVEVDAVGLTSSGSYTATGAAPGGGGDARRLRAGGEGLRARADRGQAGADTAGGRVGR